MGLLFIMPASLEEVDRISIQNDKKITLKSYGLPLIFWGYLCAIIIVLFAMWLTIQGPLNTMLSNTDQINRMIAYGVLALFIFIPGFLFAILFYEKNISKEKNLLTIIQKVFWITLSKKTYHLNTQESFTISHHMDSPNVAKIENKEGHSGFKNQGYYQLFLKTDQDKFVLIDRHSRETDLVKIRDLLSSF